MTQHSDFFGLKNPVIKNLLQCSPGAQNCLEYSWCKFEVVRNTGKTTFIPSVKDPATTFQALHKFLGSADTVASDLPSGKVRRWLLFFVLVFLVKCSVLRHGSNESSNFSATEIIALIWSYVLLL